jgi:hypothetical protein
MAADSTAASPPRPEFLALGGFYKSELEPWLASQEGRRRRARLLRWLVIGGGLALLAGLFVYASGQGWSDFWFFVIFVLGIGVVIVGNIPLSRVRSDVKQFVMQRLAEFFGFTYTERPGFDDIGLFDDLSLLPYRHNAAFEDGLEGEIKCVPFRMVDAHLTERRKSGKSSKNVTVFRGLLLSLPHPPAGDDAVAVWRRDLNRQVADDEWREAGLGDPSFDETYAVHASSAEAARRLLDRDMRHAYARLAETHGDVRLGIIDDRLLLALQLSTDSFEAGKMNRPLADPNRVQDMVELFAVPFDAVDGFKLPPAAAPGEETEGAANQ